MTGSLLNTEQLASAWLVAQRDTEAKRDELRGLQQRLSKAKADAAPAEVIKEQLIALRGEIHQLHVDSYLRDRQPVPRIAELEKKATALEAKLEKADRVGTVARGAVARIAKQIAAAEQALKASTNLQTNAHEAWAKVRQGELQVAFDAKFNGLESIISEMVALQKYLPPVKVYTMLNIVAGDIPQDILDTLARTASGHSTPSRTFEYKWLREGRASRLPSVGAAREQLEAEVRNILGDQS